MSSTLTPMPPARREAIRSMLVDQAATAATGTARPAAPAWSLKRPPVRRLALGLASCAAVGVTAAALLVGDPAAAPAFASWSALPLTAPAAAPASDDLDRWASQCTDLTGGGVAIEGVPARPEQAAARSVLVDRRGDYTFCVDLSEGSGTRSDPLIALAGIKGDDVQQSWATTTDKHVDLPTGADVLVLGGDTKTPPAGSPATLYMLYGSAGADVTGVDINLANGTRVTASVHDGLWGAWWPVRKGDPGGSRLDVHTSAGTLDIDPATVGVG
jgi:hypothetical protein